MPERTGHAASAANDTPAERLALYAGTLRRRWPIVVAVVAVAVLAGLLAAAATPKSYDATGEVLVDQQRPVDALLGAANPTPDPERDLNTSVRLVTLDPIADQVRRSLGTDLTSPELLGKVSTSVDSNSNVVSITARDGSPAGAAAIANAFAAGYRDFRARSARAAVEAAVASARRRLNRLPPGPDRRALAKQLRRLQVAAAFQTGGVQIVHRAGASTATSRPRALIAGLVAGCLGLVLAAVLVVVLTRTDRRIRDAERLEAVTGRPVLALVPGARQARRRAREALATLAMSLVHSRRSTPPPAVLLLTSPGPGEGTAEVALGLARALGEVGRRAVAIEADLRRPTFASALAVEPRGGLVDVVRGRAELDGELVELEDRGDQGETGAWALPAGPSTARPQALLASTPMWALVDAALARADVVLIASAPAGEVGDALALLPLADAVLLVARVDTTHVDDLERALRTLEDPETPLLGTVATSGPGRDRPLLPLLRAARARLGASSARSRRTASTTSEAPVR